MSIKNGYAWKNESLTALIKLKSVDKTYEQRIIFAKFCEAFDKERRLILDTVIKPNLEKLNNKDPDTLREVNEFLDKECDLKPLPAEFHAIMKKAILSEIDVAHLEPLIESEISPGITE